MRELSVQSANDTNTSDDRKQIQGEVDQLAKEITRISNTTEFNTQNLMAGGLDNTFHIGANTGQSIDVKINAMDANSLGVSRDVNVANLSSSSFGFKGASLDPTSSVPVGSSTLAATDVSTATAAGITASGAAGTAAAGDLQLNINGTNVTVTFDGTEANAAAMVTKINTAANSALGTTSQVYATGTTTISLSSNTTGSSSSVKVLASSTDAVTNALNLTEGSSAVGKDAGTIDVTFTDSASVSKTVNIKANASTIDFGNGLVLNKDVSSNTANLLDGNGTVGINISKSTSSAAALNADGKVSSEAYVAGGLSVLTQADASNSIQAIDKAISTVSTERSKLGSVQNRLEHTVNNLKTSSENLTAAESRIRDVDMAKEMMTQTKNSILAQAAQAMLAQSNQTPQGVLQLLR